jgi:hypothetical protein
MDSTAPRSPRTDAIESMLAERGHSFGPVRVAVGRSGVAVGFPRDPMVHVSWWAILATVVIVRFLRRR